MKNLLQNPLIKNILSALSVAVFGFILLNLTFLFDAVYQGVLRFIISRFIPLNPELNLRWLPPSMHASFAVVILIISWFVLRSKLRPLFKATYLTVPTATTLVTLGLFLYRWPLISYILGGLLCLCALYYLYRAKQSWLYYYAIILVGLVLFIFTLSGGEI
ncbi:MAG TPA: hypothetical protein PLR18_00015 [bacterium]|nr:hypothetical protein [bacterium]